MPKKKFDEGIKKLEFCRILSHMIADEKNAGKEYDELAMLTKNFDIQQKLKRIARQEKRHQGILTIIRTNHCRKGTKIKR